ncbi:MAG: family 20 glycosylhydrolase, partial [Verrucomicrobiota bacterium]
QFGREIPCMVIGDSPKVPHRGVQFQFPQGHAEYRPALMKHFVSEVARWKINAIYLYLESYFDFPSLPNTAGPGAMTAKDAAELDALCKSYNIMLIPQLNLMGHSGEIFALQKYAHMAEYPADKDPRTLRAGVFCQSSPDARKLAETMLQDMMDCFSSEVIHVGGDEVGLIGKCPACQKAHKGKTAFEIYSGYYSHLRDVAVRNGRKVGLWHDMVLHHCFPVETEAQQQALDNLKEGVVIYDWHYQSGSIETLDFFVKQGFETIASSSTNLCYCSSMWPAQAENQRLLFADAAKAKASGGMTTAWLNSCGLHEAHFNYLFATGAAFLWSGAEGDDFVSGMSRNDFEEAYALQRYGMKSNALLDYLHFMGDAGSPLLKSLAPIQGINVRQSLFHTDNVLTFWRQYATVLRDGGFEKYRAATATARQLWSRVKEEAAQCDDPYLHFFEGPLLVHEHLIKRFEMTEALYALYDQAAQKQFDEPEAFAPLMNQASDLLLDHLNDFPPVETYAANVRKRLGLDRATVVRLKATKKKIRLLADFMRHLGKGHRSLPSFLYLDEYFLTQGRTNWYGSREHEWSREPGRFQRYTVELEPWVLSAPNMDREPGPHLSVLDFLLSPVLPFDGDVEALEYPLGNKGFELHKKAFDGVRCHLRGLFTPGSDEVVYYVCRIRCPEAMPLDLGLGYDGPVKVWIDGKAVFLDAAGDHPAYADKVTLPFDAEEGAHEIVVALSSNKGKAIGIYFKLTRTDVEPGADRNPVLPVLEL